MARSARTISVNLNAGTAKFFSDVDAAGAKIRQFGSHTVSSMQASSASIRLLEGNFTNNIRAVERFIGTTLGLGPVLRAAFPLVGGAAFLGLIGEIGGKLAEFYKKLRDGRELAAAAFQGLNEPLRLTNDQLRVANDRLENDIAKLEGKRQNTLKLALDEARVSADKLAESLTKDLDAMKKLLEEQKAGFFEQLLGRVSDKGLREELFGKSGVGGFLGNVKGIETSGEEKIAAAKTGPESDAARRELDQQLRAAYEQMLRQIETELGIAKLNQQASKGGIADYGPLIEQLSGVRDALRSGLTSIGLQSTNEKLTVRKDKDQAAKENAQEDRPFEDRMKSMAAELDGVREKLESIGKPQAAQLINESFAQTQKIFEELNKSMERHNTSLTVAQMMGIRAREDEILNVKAEEEWKSKLDASERSISERVKSLGLLTAAIGKGYEATREANVETRLMQELGAHANDPAWMKEHAPDVDALRQGLRAEFNAEHQEQSANAIKGLNDQIVLERELARVQGEGAEAVRQATLAAKLRQLVVEGATREQIQLELELYNAQRQNAAAASIAKFGEQTQATERITQALPGGAPAQRQAELQNKFIELSRGGASAPEIAAALGADWAKHEEEVTAAAVKTGLAYKDQLASIAEQVAALNKIKAEQGDSLAIELSLRDLENQRLKTLVEESLQLRGARDGVRAFFIEMQEDAKSAAAIVYEALNTAFDRVASNLAKLGTGQKTDWAKSFQQIGGQMEESSIKGLMQKGLGSLGKAFGIDLGGAKPDGTEGNPLWVKMAGSVAVASGGPSGPGGLSLGGLFGGGAKGGGIFSLLSKLPGLSSLFGGGANMDSLNDLPLMQSGFGGFMAEGGDVEPGNAYIVGESGQELFVPRSAGSIVPNSQLGGGGLSITNHVDARGAELGAGNRIRRALETAHRSAVAMAVRATHERSLRVPARS